MGKHGSTILEASIPNINFTEDVLEQPKTFLSYPRNWHPKAFAVAQIVIITMAVLVSIALALYDLLQAK